MVRRLYALAFKGSKGQKSVGCARKGLQLCAEIKFTCYHLAYKGTFEYFYIWQSMQCGILLPFGCQLVDKII